MIIGLNGYALSGKDTVGTIIQYLTSKYKPCAIEDCLKAGQDFSKYTDWEIKKFAGKLKIIASILTNIPATMFENQEFKKKYLPEMWNNHGLPMTVRDFLQKLGTDGLREGLHPNTWINAFMVDYKEVYSGKDSEGADLLAYPNWIVTDCRFPNEAKAIKDAGGIIIRIDRPGISAINAHPSETSLDNWDFDYKIANVSDIISLAATVKNILSENKIID